MSVDYTFTIIKPCAVKSGYIGAILTDIQKRGFQVSALKFVQMTQAQAEAFYSVHKGLPFYEKLIEFMISGPVAVAILQRENAVSEYRKLIGATNPENAEEGTIRKKYAKNGRENAVHGSDSNENAAIESNFFFSQCERYEY